MKKLEALCAQIDGRIATGAAFSWSLAPLLLLAITAPSLGAEEYVAKLRRLSRVEPGTVVDNRAPEGWTHLIIKSQPKLNRRQSEKIHSMAADLARKFFTVFVADVQRSRASNPHRYRIGAVAVGMGTPIRGEDVVISSATANDLGADLGFIADIVLSQSEKELAKIVELGRSPTMVLFDAPGLFWRDGKHQQVIMRHAILVDGQSGRLDTVVWILDVTDADYVLSSEELLLLKPNLGHDGWLHVDSNELIAGVPTSKTFALATLPEGEALMMPATLTDVATARRMTPEHLKQIERTLRQVLGE